MPEHKTTRFAKLNHGLGADIDVEVAPIVNYLTDLGVETISSCQGDPGLIEAEGGAFGHAAFIIPDDEGLSEEEDYSEMCYFVGMVIRPLVEHLYDAVRLEMHVSEDLVKSDFSTRTALVGWMYFRNECIPEITKRLGCYVEMLHK